MLAPQVGMLTALVHGSVRLEMLLNVQLVLLDRQLHVLGVGIGGQDPVEVAPHSVLLVVEAIVVRAADREDVLCHQLTDHAPSAKPNLAT